MIYPLRVVTWLLSPLVKLSLLASRGLIRLVTGQSPEPDVHRLSIEELKSILTHYSDDTLSAEAREMIHKLFEFPSIPVRDIMLPRNRVQIVESQASLADVKACSWTTSYPPCRSTRAPRTTSSGSSASATASAG